MTRRISVGMLIVLVPITVGSAPPGGAPSIKSGQALLISDEVIPADPSVTEAKQQNHFIDFDPTSYMPMPFPLDREEADAAPSARNSRWVSRDLRTSGETVSDLSPSRVNVPDSDFVPGLCSPLDPLESGAGVRDFGGMTLVPDPNVLPWSVNCKVFFNQGGWGFLCSGILIDAQHVLTAGHCVHQGWGGGWSSNVTVIPAYDSGDAPFGIGRGVELHAWTGWTQSGDFDYDVGVIDLDRPVGAIVGWHGYGYDTDCSFFTDNTYHNASYPAEGPFDGCCMYHWSGTFDSCPSFNRAQFDSAGWGGMSGSGAYHVFPDRSRVVLSVASTSDRVTFFRFARLTASMFADVGEIITNDVPSEVDLVALDTNAAPASVNAGNTLSALDYMIHNYSSQSWSGTVEVDVRLSTNDIISVGDTLIQTHSWSGSLGPLDGVRISAPAPTIPAGTSAGSYWVGVILNIADHRTDNDDSSGDDAAPLVVLADCPDGLCNGDETCCTCPQDCGACCGNDLCDCAEDADSCPQDCGDTCSFTLGGAIFGDCEDPTNSGVGSVTVTVDGDGGTFTDQASGERGLWQIPNVPCGEYTVTSEKPDWTFCHVPSGSCPPDPCIASADITVDAASELQNQSIQFLTDQWCVLNDMNHDGFPSILGDVPCFVDCVYFGDCSCCGASCGCSGDCNCDGFLSILGDVPCFVECVYLGNCGTCEERTGD